MTEVLRGEVHVLEPRKMWPGGAYGSRGKIKPDELAEVGRTLVFADAPEWRETIAAMFARDAPAPQDVLDAVVRMLAEWRSSWVAATRGGGRPTGQQASRRWPAPWPSTSPGSAGSARADLKVATPPLDLRDLSSPEEAAFWRDGIDVQGDVGGQVVLLVVDATSSLWPITVAAAKLREARRCGGAADAAAPASLTLTRRRGLPSASTNAAPMPWVAEVRAADGQGGVVQAQHGVDTGLDEEHVVDAGGRVRVEQSSHVLCVAQPPLVRTTSVPGRGAVEVVLLRVLDREGLRLEEPADGHRRPGGDLRLAQFCTCWVHLQIPGTGRCQGSSGTFPRSLSSIPIAER